MPQILDIDIPSFLEDLNLHRTKFTKHLSGLGILAIKALRGRNAPAERGES